MTKTFGFSILGVLLLASPVFATVDPIAELQAQIQYLMKQIEALKAQVNPAPAMPVSCTSFANDLYVGKSDATTIGEVSKLQRSSLQRVSIQKRR